MSSVAHVKTSKGGLLVRGLLFCDGMFIRLLCLSLCDLKVSRDADARVANRPESASGKTRIQRKKKRMTRKGELFRG